MGRKFFAGQLRAVHEAYAAGLGSKPEAFSTEELTIVSRPASTWPYLIFAATFGTGTVLSVDPEYREFVSSNRPAKHFVAVHQSFTRMVVEEAARRGRSVSAFTPGLCFVLEEPPPEPAIPPGLTMREVDVAWMLDRQLLGGFENGVGRSDEAGRAARNQYGMVLFDEQDEPVAVGGVFSTFGLHEIGVDVIRSRRGQGLGQVVVAAAARAALERGGTPMYGCSVSNIRSQRTALGCGFVPAWSDSSVS